MSGNGPSLSDFVIGLGLQVCVVDVEVAQINVSWDGILTRLFMGEVKY